jgi:hypothetical protein
MKKRSGACFEYYNEKFFVIGGANRVEELDDAFVVDLEHKN